MRTRYAYAALLCFVLLIPSLASAQLPIFNQYGLQPFWPNGPIPYLISAAGSSQILNGSEFQAVQAAFQTWQNISGATITFKYLGTTPVSSVGRDGLSVVTFADDNVPLGSATVSATFSFVQIDPTDALLIQESDIALNPALPFSTTAEAGKYDIQSVVTHEVGHLLGLNHSPLLSSVMAPRSAPGQLDQRTLTFDDIAGAEQIYPGSTAFAGIGAIAGNIFNGLNSVFGAHVIALDVNGTAVASNVSFGDGSYFVLVHSGTYRLVAEPLDGPVFESDIGGTPSSYYYKIDTGFGTTYYGDVADLSSAKSVSVSVGRTSVADIDTLSAASINLTYPATFAPRVGIGGQANLTLGGTGVASGTTFTLSGTGMTVGTVTYGGSVGGAATSATVNVSVPSTVALGPKNIALSQNGATTILAGGVVVTNPAPTAIQVSPASGTTDGGVQVTISGQNFQTGAQVYFGGLAASAVSFVSAQSLKATTPTNIPGQAAVVVVNPDGTWGVQPQGFSYTATTPSITSVTPTTAAPGAIVQIQGTEFDTRLQNVTVQFNGTAATVISSTRTSIQAAVPYNSTSGAISVNVLGQTAKGPNFTVGPVVASANTPGGTFVDASTSAGGTALTMLDPDESSPLVLLPFNFTLFDKTYASGAMISVSTNGWMSLDAVTAPDYQSISLPGTTASAMIAPFFDDLFIRSGGAVMTRTVGTSPNRQLVVEWSNMGVLDATGADRGASLTFEAVLYESTNDIQFVYQSASGPGSDGSTATIGFQNSARNKAVMAGFHQSMVSSGLALAYQFANGSYVKMNGTPSTFAVTSAGAASFVTSGTSANLTVGYAGIQQSGSAPASGVAIFDYRTNGVLVTEAAVPASGLISQGRIYAVVGSSGGTAADTGIAIANPNPSAATITFNFTDANGNDFGSGTTVVPANGQIAKFIDQAPFNAPPTMQGTMTFTSSAPVSVVALQGLTNERSEFLITTLPVTDLSAKPGTAAVTIPHFAAGGGWTTQVVLVNSGSSALNGTIQFVGNDGTSQTPIPYTVTQKSSFQYQTSGSGSNIQTGSVRVTPGGGSATPVALTIFSFKNNGVTVTQSGAPVVSSTALRTYVEASGSLGAVGSIQSGIAIANSSASSVNVTLNLTDLTGTAIASTTLTLGPNAQTAQFLNQIFASANLPQSLQGMLEIKSASPGVAAAGLRGRYNERADFLITTTPMLDENAPVTGAQYFPHFADGGGYTTQFVLFSGTVGQTASGALVFSAQDGSSLAITLHK